ncbi:hypothetical protein [Hymenobacter jeollabukensis]|uniref:hypothetical protein n=1 Tax=Hymenobacter jeollabukensis TaxID=2025313 RepID=UPI0010FF24DD|nr:hypothetical protein [Hymenobacter jeollabukensis]
MLILERRASPGLASLKHNGFRRQQADYGVNLARGNTRCCGGGRLTLHSSLVAAPKRPHHRHQNEERQRFHGRKANHGLATLNFVSPDSTDFVTHQAERVL